MLRITFAFFLCLVVTLGIEAGTVRDFRKKTSSDDVEDRIIGGTLARKGEFPYVVSIKDLSSGIPVHFCGGVILDTEHILTSAICMANVNPGIPTDILVVAGEHDQTVNEGTEQRMAVLGVLNHEQFNFFTLQNDIAILRLFEPLTLNENVATVLMPTTTSEPTAPFCTAVGWGANSGDGPGLVATLQKVQLPAMSDEACNNAYSGDVTASMICFGGDGRDTCQGDIGGPLLCGSEGAREIQGITSWGAAKCGTNGLPTVFTQVSHYLQWIQDHS